MSRRRPPPSCTGCASRSAATAETKNENPMRGLNIRLSTKATRGTALALAPAPPASARARAGATGLTGLNHIACAEDDHVSAAPAAILHGMRFALGRDR